MSTLALIALLANVATEITATIQGQGSTATGPGTPLEKVLSEVTAALASAISASGVPITAAQVEALRTKQAW